MVNRNSLIAVLAGIGLISPLDSIVSASVPRDAASSFDASLAAARARAGDTYVNGTMNVLVEPSRVISKPVAVGGIASAVPVTVVDARAAVTQVNVVVQSSARLVVDRPTTVGQTVEIVPVMTKREFSRSTSWLPFGGVVIPNQNGLRAIKVVRFMNLSDVVVR